MIRAYTVAALLCSLLWTGAATAADTVPLSADEDPLVLGGGGTGTAQITNETGVELSLRLSVVDDSGKVLQAIDDERRLDAGATTAVAVAPDPPAKSTLLVVARPAAGLPSGATLRVGVVTRAAVAPSVEDWEIHREQGTGWEGLDLPLNGQCSGLGLKKATAVGVVQADGVEHQIKGHCDLLSAHSLKLEVVDLRANGRSYSGKIKVGAKEVSLTVEDTWPWWGVMPLILAGIAFALGLLKWRGWGRTARTLLRLSFEIEQLVRPSNPKNADAAFARAATKLKLPDHVREWTIAAAVKAKLDAVRKTNRAWTSPDSAELKKQKTALTRLEANVRGWSAVPNKLSTLSTALTKLTALPAYVEAIRARTLDRRGPLDIPAMHDVKVAADEAVALAVVWPGDVITATQATASNLPHTDEGRRAHGALTSALDRMRTADTRAAALEAEEEFWTAHTLVIEAHETETRMLLGPQDESERDPSTPPASHVDTEDPAEAAAGLAFKIFLNDTVALVFLLLVAVIAGMKELWVGETFGGFWDLAAAITWGAGAATVAAPLASALGDARASWRTGGTED